AFSAIQFPLYIDWNEHHGINLLISSDLRLRCKQAHVAKIFQHFDRQQTITLVHSHATTKLSKQRPFFSVAYEFDKQRSMYRDYVRSDFEQSWQVPSPRQDSHKLAILTII